MTKRSDPAVDLSDFYDFVRNDISVEVTNFQLKDKIRRLRNSYMKIREKEESRGKDRVFTRENAARRHQLSKQIWEEDRIDGVEITIGQTEMRRRRSGKRPIGEVGEPSRGVGVSGDGLDMTIVPIPETATNVEEAMVEGGERVDEGEEWLQREIRERKSCLKREEFEIQEMKLDLEWKKWDMERLKLQNQRREFDKA